MIIAKTALGTIYRHPYMEQNQFIDEYKINSLENKAFKKYMKCKWTQPILKEQLNAKYKAIKTEITARSRQCKKDYYYRYFTENKDNLQMRPEIENINSLNLWKAIGPITSQHISYTCLKKK